MALINGTLGSDTLDGTNNSDLIFGFTGDDTINGHDGGDTIDGGDGNDNISTRNASLYADNDFDRVFAGNGDDRVYGGLGDDLYGGIGVDRLSLDYSNAAAGVTFDSTPMTLGITELIGGVLTTVFEVLNINGGNIGEFEIIERFTGTDFNDHVTIANNAQVGTLVFAGAGDDYVLSYNGADTLYGQDGNDTLIGGLGQDELFGGDGDDLLNGSGGADDMRGGAGNDLYKVNSLGDQTVEGAGAGHDSVVSGIDWTLSANIEDLVLAGPASVGIGNTLDNRIGGHDRAETLQGLGGNDRLLGQRGADVLEGGTGNDILVGGQGADDLLGGSGQDVFLYYETGDLTANRSLTDTIMDFSQVDRDRISLQAIDANTATEENEAFAFIGGNGFSQTAGELRAVQIEGQTYVSGDVDGDGLADFQIHVAGLVDMTARDFVL